MLLTCMYRYVVHISHNQGNFGAFYLDWLCGTMDAYIVSCFHFFLLLCVSPPPAGLEISLSCSRFARRRQRGEKRATAGGGAVCRHLREAPPKANRKLLSIAPRSLEFQEYNYILCSGFDIFAIVFFLLTMKNKCLIFENRNALAADSIGVSVATPPPSSVVATTRGTWA